MSQISPGFQRVVIDPAKAFDSFARVSTTSQSGGITYLQKESYARYKFKTDAPYIGVEVVNDAILGVSGFNAIGLRVGGVARYDNGTLFPSLGNAVQRYWGLPGAGTTLELIDGGGSTLGFHDGTSHGTPIAALYLPFGASAVFDAPTAPAKRLVYCGDSRGGGVGSGSGPFKSSMALARENIRASVVTPLGGAETIIDAPGGSSWYNSANTLALRNLAIARLTPQLNGSTANYLIIEREVNDWLDALWTAAQMETAAGLLLDAINAAFPALKIILVSSTTATNETVANAVGSTLPNYRSALVNLQATRTAYCSYIAGPALVTYPYNLMDTVHWNASGHVEHEATLRAALVALGFGY